MRGPYAPHLINPTLVPHQRAAGQVVQPLSAQPEQFARVADERLAALRLADTRDGALRQGVGEF